MLFFCRYTFITMCIMLVAFLTGCNKDDDAAAIDPPDRSRIGYLLEDNFNYTTCNSLLSLTGQINRLKSDTMFTFLAPDNDAFLMLGYNVIPASGDGNPWFDNIARNLILPGVHTLRRLPLGDNQPLGASSGFKVYVNRYKLGNDTITRINGAKVAVIDIYAGNGQLQSMAEVIQAETRKDMVTMLLNDTSFTLFTQALQHSGLLPSLKAGEYTLLALHNSVLRSKGLIQPGINLSTSVDILATDRVALAALLKYHILPGRYFLDGIHRAAAASGNASITTLQGTTITIGGNMEMYNSTTFRGRQNASVAAIFRQGNERFNYANMPVGNGVVHTINQVLIP